ncbi:tetratricopeptide repeat protein [Virgisporangium aurantiacum]|uniref:ORC1/DEAH AAA+ ATPase domain-containing protein n=1 Tax=Virgisporangium aurantiacum TaxID=175570 RepID=A0A8J4E6H3_9ACTN|nr:tetratricopeptide repeat protein [Virgisporangium aurantiacum]GIJ63163.1 hypothetical protein Vau01_106790 [Virgisporangium aurantiacum]
MIDAPLDPELRRLLPRQASGMLETWCQNLRQRVELVRQLDGGFTPALVAKVIVSNADGTDARPLVMKYLPPRERTRLEYKQFEAATTAAPQPFQGRLVGVRKGHLVTVARDSIIIFMECATLGGREPDPLSVLLGDERLGAACEGVVKAIVEDWNGAPERQVKQETADEYLKEMAGWTCKARGPLHEWLRTNWPELLDRGREQLPGDGDTLPNPVHLVRYGGALRGRTMLVLRGHSHGDLHTENILIPAARTGARHFGRFLLIDLSTYRTDGFLAYDPMYLVCSILARRMEDLPDDGAPLIDLMLGERKRSRTFPDDIGRVGRLVSRACRRSILADNWTLNDWEPNLLLALTGTALIFAGRKTSGGLRANRWFVTFAARAAQEALNRLPPPEPARVRGTREGFASWAHLIDDVAFRILIVAGPEGIGKTYALRRRLNALQQASENDLAVRPIDIHAGSTFGAADLVAALEQAFGRKNSPLASASGRSGDLLLGRLDPLLDRNAHQRVVVALDSADHLVDRSRALRDVSLDDALQLLSDRTDHRVSVLLVGREQPKRNRGWVDDADVHKFDEGLTREELKAFFAVLDGKGVYRVAHVGDATWDLLHERTRGNPRAAELMFALLDFTESEFETLGDVAAFVAGVQPTDVLDALFGAVLEGLDDLHHQVLLTLAVYRIAVGVDAVQTVVGAERVGRTLRRLAARNVIRQDDHGRFYLQAPDDSRVIDALGGEAAIRDLGMRAEAYLAGIPVGRIERLPDLWAHRARIDILISCGDFSGAVQLMDDVEEYLRKWGYSWLLIDQRERIRPHLRSTGDVLANLNWLAAEYVEVGRFDEAEKRYREALALADGARHMPRRKRILTNLAGVLFQRGDIDDAVTTYEDALSIARENGRPAEEVAPLEGLAGCYRHYGDFAAAKECLEEALRLAGDVERRGGRVMGLLLKLARRDIECARYGEAGDRIRQVAEILDERADPLTACHRYDIEADLNLARGETDLALVFARRAANLAADLGDPRVFVQARTTLAAVYLDERPPRLKEARHEIEVAARRRSIGDSLLVLGMQALVRTLLREPETGDVFDRLRDEAVARRRRDGKDFAAWDFEGFALCGLVLNGRASLSEAEYAFDRARSICRPAGLVDRLGSLLKTLDAGSGRLEPAIAAALGDLGGAPSTA